MTIQIENIEDARRREGIDDVVLRNEIARLKSGDHVRLSVSADGRQYEVMSVRITSVKGSTIRGKMLSKPRAAGLKNLLVGSPVLFSADQVHSIVDGKPAIDDSCAEIRTTTAKRVKRRSSRSDSCVAVAAPKATATKPRRRTPPHLRVEGDVPHRYVMVPSELAGELHRYFRTHQVWSSPPQPYLTDFDRIELDRNMDVLRVQALLKAWR